MLLRIFRNTDPFVIFLIVAAVVLFSMNSLLNPGMESTTLSDADPMPLYALLKAVTANNFLAGVIVTMLMLLLMAYMLVSLNTSVIFIDERTFLPAIIYILLVSLFPDYLVLNPVLPAALLLIAAVRKIMDTYRVQGIAYDLYDAGFLLSAGSLFYANFIFFGILLVAGIIILRSIVFRELFLALLGFMTPYLLISAIWYISGRETFEVLDLLSNNIRADIPDYIQELLPVLLLIFPVMLVIISILHLLSVINTKKIKSRNTFYLLLWVLVISVVVFIISPSVSVDIIWLAGIPAAYFLSHFFVFMRNKRVKEISFTILILAVIFMHLVKFI
ncbi:MAG TPA: DUF6427 family protein [Bacteroidales bacterium]|nr:DUF6427 family protein [Bacteroidales bacterium]